MKGLNPYEPPQSIENEASSPDDLKSGLGFIHEGATNCLWAFAIMCSVTLMGIIVTFGSVDSLNFYDKFLYGYFGSFYLQTKGLVQLRRGSGNVSGSTATFTAAIWLFCSFWLLMIPFYVPIMLGSSHVVGQPITLATIGFTTLNLAYHLALLVCFVKIGNLLGEKSIAQFSIAAFITLFLSLGAGILLNILVFEEQHRNIGLPTVTQRNHSILYTMVFISLFVISHACYGIALRLIQLQTRKYKHLPKQSESDRS
jgi:hypothetical protein